QYQKQLLFRLFSKEFGAMPLDQLTPEHLRVWRNHLRRRLAPGTVRYHLDVFSSVLTVGHEMGWLTEQPMRKVRKPPVSQARVRFLDAEEQVRLLAACKRSKCPFLHALVLLAMITGMRKREMLRLTWRDVDLERGMARLTRTKNGERRAVPMP